MLESEYFFVYIFKKHILSLILYFFTKFFYKPRNHPAPEYACGLKLEKNKNLSYGRKNFKC